MKKESSTINVLEDPDNAKAAFDLMEGEGWWDGSIHADRYGKDHPMYANSLAAWIAYRSWNYHEEQPKYSHGFGPEIYGSCGYHRYYIKKDGTAVYSVHHGQDDADDAKSLGFLLSQ